MPRNSSGTYTLPAGNPVVPNTLIDTNWANPTMSDIGASITDSLDRFGRGGMLAQLKLADGTLAQPAFAFNSESSTGLLRPSAGNFQVSVLGVLIAAFSSTGTLFSLAPSYAADPVSANQLARKSYVDNLVTTGYLPLTGGTLSGPGNLVVNGTLGVGVIPTVKFQVLNTTPAASPAWNAADSIVSSATTNNLMQLHAGATGGTIGYVFAVGAQRSQGGMNYVTATDTLSLFTAQINALNIDNAQNVGIGTAAVAQSRLEVRGATPAITVNGTSGASFRGVRITTNTTEIATLYAEPSAGELRLTAGFAGFGGFMTLWTNGVERIRADVNGQVGIGRTPTCMLDVFNTAAACVERLRGASGSGLGAAICGAIGNDVSRWALGSYGNIYGGAVGDDTAIYSLGFLSLGAGGTERAQITSAGVFNYGGNEIGWKDIPRTTGGFTRGQCFAISAGQTVNTQATGQAYSVYNDSAANVTLTQGAGLTLRLNGTATTGNRTLLARGFATIWYNSATEAVITGAIT